MQKQLEQYKIDALFISNQYNVTYLTGFAGLSSHEREGFLFITKQSALLLTFPTYFLMYEKGGTNFTTACITAQKHLSDHLDIICTKEKIKRIGLEKDNVTISELESLQKKVKVAWIQTKDIVERFRLIKTNEEITAIRKAAQITDRAFDFIRDRLRVGVSEKDIALELEFFIKKNSQDVAFSPIVAFNQNAAIPHYIPSADSKLSPSSLILLDFGAKQDNYCSDMTRVVFLSTPSNKLANIYTTVCTAQQKALDHLEVGTSASLTDTIAKQHIQANGFPLYEHGLGHGVGLAIHESPRLRHSNSELLRENMVVTIEPGIYIAGFAGVRIEDLVVLRKGGNEILSKSIKEMIVL